MEDSMYPVFAVLKELVLPPLNLVVLALLGWGIGRRWPQLGRVLVSLALCSLYFLATPYGSFLLARSLQTSPVLTSDRWEKAAGAIVVLGGGIYEYAPEYGKETVGRSTLERLRYGAHLARELQLPLLVSGGS